MRMRREKGETQEEREKEPWDRQALKHWQTDWTWAFSFPLPPSSSFLHEAKVIVFLSIPTSLASSTKLFFSPSSVRSRTVVPSFHGSTTLPFHGSTRSLLLDRLECLALLKIHPHPHRILNYCPGCPWLV